MKKSDLFGVVLAVLLLGVGVAGAQQPSRIPTEVWMSGDGLHWTQHSTAERVCFYPTRSDRAGSLCVPSVPGPNAARVPTGAIQSGDTITVIEWSSRESDATTLGVYRLQVGWGLLFPMVQLGP